MTVYRMTRGTVRYVLVSLLLVLGSACLYSCGSSKHAPDAAVEQQDPGKQSGSVHGTQPPAAPDTGDMNPAAGNSRPSLGQLKRMLETELERIPDTRRGSAVPGPGSAVHDLVATRISEIDEQLNRIELRWTAHLPGDYDGNGEVNGSDLTPLAVNWNRQVIYLPAEEAGGNPHLPAGDPADGGVGTANWGLAQIDGNADGIIGLADVTVIAQHWRERISGYIIRRTDLGSGESVDLEGTLQEEFTVSYAAAGSPVRDYAITDELAVPGDYEYHAIAYDHISAMEGPASNPAAYRLNALPVAEFSYGVDEGPEPYMLSLDAGASRDDDGEIVLYEWDIDGDGEFELAGSTPLAEASIPGSTSLLSLRVTDDSGARAIASRTVELESSLMVELQVDNPVDQLPHTAVITPVLSGSMPAQEFNWLINGVPRPELASDTAQPIEYTAEQAGPSWIQLRVTGADGVVRKAGTILTTHGLPAASISIDKTTQYLPGARYLVRVEESQGHELQYRLFINGSRVSQFEDRSWWEIQPPSPGYLPVHVEVQDSYGNIARSNDVHLQTVYPPAIEFSYDPAQGNAPLTLDWELSDILDTHSLIEAIEINVPTIGILPDTSSLPSSGSLEIEDAARMDEIHIRLEMGALQEDVFPELDFHYPVDFGLLDLDFSISPQSIIADSISSEVEITRYDSFPPVVWHRWYTYEPGGQEELNGKFLFQIEKTGSGTHDIRLEAYNGYGMRSVRKRISIYQPGEDVVVIRNDNADYPDNLAALTSDMDALGLSWQMLSYHDTVADDLAPFGHCVVLWYRGGPANSQQPRLERAWTTAEIDSYMEILQQGRPMLIVSQNSAKLTDAPPEYSSGWDLGFDGTLHANTVDPAEFRTVWSTGQVSDDGLIISSGKILTTSPQSFTADVGSLRSIDDDIIPVEAFDGLLSSGYVPLSVDLGGEQQLMGSASIRQFSVVYLSSAMIEGLSPEEMEYANYPVAMFSWGCRGAPHDNVGFYPDYDWSGGGTASIYVIGYPWAAVDITESEPPGMTRADMLLNIIAWLKEDYDPQFQ